MPTSKFPPSPFLSQPVADGFKQGGRDGAYVIGNVITLGLDDRVNRCVDDAWERAQANDDYLTQVGFYGGMAGGMATQALVIPMGGGSSSAGGRRLVHLTNSGAGASINQSGTLIGNIYAGPLANAGKSGLGLTFRTGLDPRAYQVAVPISQKAAGAFSRITRVGPLTTLQRFTGQQCTARGVLNLQSGEFIRHGVNWNQATTYIIDVGIDVTVGTAGVLYWFAGSGDK